MSPSDQLKNQCTSTSSRLARRGSTFQVWGTMSRALGSWAALYAVSVASLVLGMVLLGLDMTAGLLLRDAAARGCLVTKDKSPHRQELRRNAPGTLQASRSALKSLFYSRCPPRYAECYMP